VSYTANAAPRYRGSGSLSSQVLVRKVGTDLAKQFLECEQVGGRIDTVHFVTNGELTSMLKLARKPDCVGMKWSCLANSAKEVSEFRRRLLTPARAVVAVLA